MSHNRYVLSQPGVPASQGQLLYFSTSVYEGDWSSVPHSHPITELFYVINGSGIVVVDGVRQPVRQYDLLIINPYAMHTEEALPAQPMEYVALGVKDMTLGPENQSFFLGSFREYKDELLDYLRLLTVESQREQPVSDEIRQYLFAVLLLLQRHSGLCLVQGESSPTLPKMVPPECDRVKNYIDSYYSEHITLADLARIAGWDRYYLSHIFTKMYGLSPMNYLLEKRLDCAKALLTNSDYTITEISQMLGFSSQNCFTQMFKKKTGVTVSAYRGAGPDKK